MTMADGRESSRDTAKTIGGALSMLVVGVALGLGWNAMGLASKPARGLPWIASPQPTPSVESLQPPAGRVAPTETMIAPARGLALADTAMARAAAVAPPRTTAAKPPPALASAVTPLQATTPSPAPARPSVVAPRRAVAPDSAHAPAATPPAPAASAPAPVAELPVIPDVTGPLTVELAAFKRLYDAGAALVVDAREPGSYEQGHIAGAISLPYNGALADPGRVERLDSGARPIVVYCSGATCEMALDLAKFLVESGKRKVLVFEGGYHDWQGAGYPIEHGPAAGARP